MKFRTAGRVALLLCASTCTPSFAQEARGVGVEPGSPTTQDARAATPRDMQEMATRIIANYPVEALREMQQGTVAVRVMITAEGGVGSCTVTRTSGYLVLDAAACDEIRTFGVFHPARDNEDNAVAGSWSTAMVYQINEIAAPPPPL